MAKAKAAGAKVMTEAEKIASKKDAFMRVVPNRVNNAVKALRLVRQCSSSNYLSSDEQKRAILTAIGAEVKELEASFAGKASSGGGFVLPD